MYAHSRSASSCRRPGWMPTRCNTPIATNPPDIRTSACVVSQIDGCRPLARGLCAPFMVPFTTQSATSPCGAL
jgi:hypothetical protein